jgi:serine/threonine protein kinase
MKVGTIGEYRIIAAERRTGDAKVFSAKHEKTGENVVIREYSGVGGSPSEVIKHEVDVLESVSHDYVCKLRESFAIGSNFYLVMNGINGTSLARALNPKRPMSEDSAKLIVLQLLEALEYLHGEKKVILQNLNAGTVFIDLFGNVKICDLSAAVWLLEDFPNYASTLDVTPYTAPEIILDAEVTQAIDIWSLGVLLAFITFGELPFQTRDSRQLRLEILNHDPKLSLQSPSMLSDLIMRMLEKDPSRRPTIEGIKQHPWLCVESYLASQEKIVQAPTRITKVPDKKEVINDHVKKGIIGDPCVYFEVLREKVNVELRSEYMGRRGLESPGSMCERGLKLGLRGKSELTRSAPVLPHV